MPEHPDYVRNFPDFVREVSKKSLSGSVFENKYAQISKLFDMKEVRTVLEKFGGEQPSTIILMSAPTYAWWKRVIAMPRYPLGKGHRRPRRLHIKERK
mgnify:CR=1 FL=1